MLYKLVSSLKTSVYLLMVMCAVFLVGTIFPQGEHIDDYIEAGGTYVGIVRTLDFLDIFSSPLFIAATAALLINLSFCLYDRLKIYLRSKRKPMEFRSLKQHPHTVMFSDAQMENRLRKAGFTLKTETPDAADPGVKMYEKGIPFWWLSWFYHLGIILSIAGFFMTDLLAFEKDVLLYPGQPEAISLYSRETGWNRFLEGMGRNTADSTERDEYVLSLKEFRTEYYQGLKIDYPEETLERLAVGTGIKKLTPSREGFSYMPKMWLTRLEVERPDGSVLDAELRVNRPFRTGGLTLYQMGFEQKVTLLVNDEHMEVEARIPFKVEGVEGKFVLGPLTVGSLFKRDGSTEEIKPFTTLYHISEDKPSEKEEIGALGLNGHLDAKGITFEFREYREGSYVSYRKDPGVWLVGLACLFVFLGLIVRCLGAWYRVQCTFEKNNAYVLVSTRGILADRDRILNTLGRRD